MGGAPVELEPRPRSDRAEVIELDLDCGPEDALEGAGDDARATALAVSLSNLSNVSSADSPGITHSLDLLGVLLEVPGVSINLPGDLLLDALSRLELALLRLLAGVTDLGVINLDVDGGPELAPEESSPI